VTVSDRTRRGYTPAPEPPDEPERLRALQNLAILDTDPEEAYDDLAVLASFICGVPMALVTLLDRDRQWFKAHRGLDATETPRDVAFCGYTILQDDFFVVPDATKDARFAGNPLVTGDPHVRFYAGVPLRTVSGHRVGTLCVLDEEPHDLNADQRKALGILGKQATNLLEMRLLMIELRRAATAEHETASRLAAIYDAATEVAILALSPAGIITSFNRGAERMLGHSAASVVDRESALILFDEHELDERAQALSSVFSRKFEDLDAILEYPRQGSYEHRDWTLRHHDGHTVVVDLVVTAMRDALGAVSGFVAVAKDVTDRKRAEEASRESEKWFEILSEASPVGIFRTDVDGHCQYTNSRWQEIAGISLEESLGAGWANAIHPDDRDTVFAQWSQSIRRGLETESEYRFLRPTGEVALVHSRTRALTDAKGKSTGFVGTVEDITAARRSEEELRASEQRMRAILDNMLGSLITIDQQSVITSLNRAAEKLFGYSADELVGKSLTLLVPDSVSDKPGYLREARTKSLGHITEWEGQRKNGTVFPFELSMFAFPTARGMELAGSVRDISDRRAAERAKKEFISTVSHELRTPLTSIRGSLRLLTSGVMGELNPEVRRMAEVAERNSNRLLSLINDLLDLERIEGGRMTMEIGDVPLESVLRKSVETVSAFALQEKVEIRVAATREHVRADEYRLAQVVVNLLSNAVKFSPPGSVVDVTAEARGDDVEVRVIDHGKGVPASAREVIFERFRQADASDSKAKGGAGLGLAISKAIVEQHGGTIGVDSEEGRGSTFWFRVLRVIHGDEGSAG
jgi:PAS domain S-box-containing protein